MTAIEYIKDLGLSPEGYLRGLVKDLVPTADWTELDSPLELGGHRVITDGRIGDQWVVELEARTMKQIRGAIVDLAISAPVNKLLVVLFKPTEITNVDSVRKHLEEVVQRLKFDPKRWCIVSLSKQETRGEHIERLKGALAMKGLL